MSIANAWLKIKFDKYFYLGNLLSYIRPKISIFTTAQIASDFEVKA
jgi:hypothetical protein